MKRLFALCLVAVLIPCLALARTDTPLRPDEKKKLDTFFSNFAEANMKSFDRGSLTDEALLYFAIWHCIFNAADSLKRTNDGNHIVIPADVIDKVTEKYLGQKIKTHKKPDYVDSLATGEAYVFAQVDDLQKRDDETWLAKGTVYYTGSGAAIDPHGSPKDWEKAGEDVRVSAKFTGTIQKAGGEKGRYILLEYAVTEVE